MSLLPDAPEISLSCDGVLLAAACRVRHAEIRRTGGATEARLVMHGPGADALLPGKPLQLSASGQRLFEGQVRTLSMARGQAGYEFVARCEGTPAPAAAAGKIDIRNGPALLEHEATLSASGLSGHVRCRGMLTARPGDEITLAGLPAAFARPLPVAVVLHELTEAGWTTRIDFGEVPAHAPEAICLQDSHGNRLRLDASGITLDSPAGIALNGMNIDCRAQVAFTAKGAAMAELSASGQTTIKGAMVMIN